MITNICFNPRPHAEGDLINPFGWTYFSALFQSTPSRGGRRALFHNNSPLVRVSIHALTRRATILKKCAAPISWFQSTPSRGGRQKSIGFMYHILGFNPRPHAEGDRTNHGTGKGALLVSIHALTRRATKLLIVVRPAVMVSIHALTRRATCTTYKGSVCSSSFNPRPHAEGDQLPHGSLLQSFVSIHALTRRATSFFFCVATPHCCFNPRPHAEGDLVRIL